MQTAIRRYDWQQLFSLFLFLIIGISAIILRQPWLIAIPFAWVLFLPVVQFLFANAANFFWLLFILLPLSTEISFTPQLGMDIPDEPVLMLLTGFALLKLIHEPGWFPRALSLHPLFMLLVVYMGWVCITCIYATEPLPAWKYLLAKTWYIVPFVLLPQKMITGKEQVCKMAIWMLGSMFLVMIQALIRHSFYGFSFDSVKHIFDPFFRNHVSYSSMLVCLLAVAWCVWKLTPADNPKRKWIMYGMVIGLAGLFFAYSRGAWAALLIGVIGAWALRKKIIEWMICIAVLGVIISTAWLVTDKNFMRFTPEHDQTIFHSNFSDHMTATVHMKDVSTAERFYRWVAGANMLAEKPVTGFGPNSFYPNYFKYTVRGFKTWVSANPEHSTVHNYFLLVALEQGITGLVLFCALFFGMIWYAQKLYHQLHDRFYKMTALTTGVVLIMIGVINFMSDMIETDKIGGIFWLCLGMIVVLEQKNKEQRSKEQMNKEC